MAFPSFPTFPWLDRPNPTTPITAANLMALENRAYQFALDAYNDILNNHLGGIGADRPFVNVLDHGVVGNLTAGSSSTLVTANTTAINNVIANFGSTNVIYWPKGNYYVNSNVILKSKTHLL